MSDLGGSGFLPDRQELAPMIPWIHVPTDRPLKGYVTCEKHFGAWVHFFPGGSTFHQSEGCWFCANEKPPVFKWWLSLWQPDFETHGIIEFGERQIGTLKAWYRNDPSLRGLCLEATHNSTHRFSRIELTANGSYWPQTDLPESLDLPALVRQRLLSAREKFGPPQLRAVG